MAQGPYTSTFQILDWERNGQPGSGCLKITICGSKTAVSKAGGRASGSKKLEFPDEGLARSIINSVHPLTDFEGTFETDI